MSYTKHNFQTGQVFRASHANEMQNGIATNADAIAELQTGLVTANNNTNTKLDKNIGANNTGKMLVVDSTGNIVAGEAPTTLAHDLDTEGKAADSRVVGNAIDDINNSITKMNTTDLEQSAAIQEATQFVKDVKKSMENRIKNLQAAANGYLYREQVDAEKKIEKDIPSGAMPYASVDKVGARSIAWNQILKNFTTTSGVWNLRGDAEGVVSHSNTSMQYNVYPTWNFAIYKDHKYYLSVEVKSEVANKLVLFLYTSGTGNITSANSGSSDFERLSICATAGESKVCDSGHIAWTLQNRKTDSSTWYARRPQFFDLTVMFGMGNQPTKEQFEAMFPEEYYPYSDFTMMTFAPKYIVTRGTNMFDESIMEDATATVKYYHLYVGDGTFTAQSGYTTGQTSTSAVQFLLPGKVTSGISSINNGVFKDKLVTVQSVGGYVTIAYRIYNNNKPTDRFFMLNKGNQIKQHVPYNENVLDLSSVVEKCFPDGMKSAGAAYDEIDLERGVAIKRVGEKLMKDISWSLLSAVNGFNRIEGPIPERYVFAYGDYSSHSENTICPKFGTVNYATTADNTIALRPDVTSIRLLSAKATTVNEVITMMGNDKVYYELAEPIETPITESIDPYISVEAGGTVEMVSQHGTDYRVGLPNQETYMIKLPTMGTQSLATAGQ